MKLKEISHSELVHLCSREPENRKAWGEFFYRFDKHILTVVYRECKTKFNIANKIKLNELIKDIVQDVNKKLVVKDCQALRTFKGEFENSIYPYLGRIAKSLVLNKVTEQRAQKRPDIAHSLDDPIKVSEQGEPIPLKDQLAMPEDELENKLNFEALKNDIEEILDEYLTGSKKERDKFIIKLILYKGFTPEEVIDFFNYDIAISTVYNLRTNIKKILRRELLKRRMVA